MILIIFVNHVTFKADTTSAHAHGRKAAFVSALCLPKRASRQPAQSRTASTQERESLLRHVQSAWHADNTLPAGQLEGYHRH